MNFPNPFRRKPSPRQQAEAARAREIAEAEAARTAALEPLQRAIRRKDTRAQHDRFPAAFSATTAALRMELGRS